MIEIPYYNLLKDTAPVKHIRQAVGSNTLGHSYMITAQGKLTLTNVLRIIAVNLFCKNNGCMSCPACIKVVHNNEPDLIWMEQEKYSVSDIEAMQDEAYRSNMGNGYKVFVIVNADSIQTRAQNKLLKILEEPPEKTIFLLGVMSEYAMLDTIKSRCLKLSVEALPTDILYAYYKDKGYDDSKLKLALSSSDGIIDNIEQILADDNYITLYNSLLDILTSLKSSKEISSALTALPFSKENLNISLNILEKIFRDTMVLNNKGTEKSIIINNDARMNALAGLYSLEASIHAQDAIYEAKRKSAFSCNALNVTDALLTKLMEVKYKCRKL